MAKWATTADKQSILTEFCSKIDHTKQKAAEIRPPYDFVSSLVTESKSGLPWITWDAIMNTYRKHQHKAEQEKETNTLEDCLTLASIGSYKVKDSPII